MLPTLTFSPFPISPLGNLLALLELARDGGDPIDHPTPWAWTPWRKTLLCDYAPWQTDATLHGTGMYDNDRAYSRAFVVAYHTSGEERDDRVRFATELSEGDPYKGRERLTSWWRRRWNGPILPLDSSVIHIMCNAGFLKQAIRSPTDLDVALITRPCEVVHALGQALFGPDAFVTKYMPRPDVSLWLKHVLHLTRNDWIQIHNGTHRHIHHLLQSVFHSCQDLASDQCWGLDIISYLGTLEALVDVMNFSVGENRMSQVEHYRKILFAIESSMANTSTAESPSDTPPVLPPNMVRALGWLPLPAHREQIQWAIQRCHQTLNYRARHPPTETVDHYEIMSHEDFAFMNGRLNCTDEDVDDWAKRIEVWDENNDAGIKFAKTTLPRLW
ncbi:hypothetical protein LXA43DRAFT_1063500 [Ganoderma leucocontextum]|nr:hypothetical protein LXA43DRAFT_1063500 [Ganoderma leucocontextum]